VSSSVKDLRHLTQEEVNEILQIYPKNRIETVPEDSENIPEKEVEKGLEKKSEEQKEDWKEGYLDYEVKNKGSNRLSYEEEEIEILEEDV